MVRGLRISGLEGQARIGRGEGQARIGRGGGGPGKTEKKEGGMGGGLEWAGRNSR